MKLDLQYAAVGDCLCVSREGHIYAVAAREINEVPCADACVAVIFSLSPTLRDFKRGFTHGYALAATDAAAPCRWVEHSAWEHRFLWKHLRPRHEKLPVPSGFLYREGLNDSRIMNCSEDYPAFCATGRYSPVERMCDAACWFLPSAGQWLEVLSALTFPHFTEAGNAENAGKSCVSTDGNALAAQLDARFAAIPNAMRFCNGDNDIFWTGTSAGNGYAYGLGFYPEADTVCVRAYPVSARCRVRAAIAF